MCLSTTLSFVQLNSWPVLIALFLAALTTAAAVGLLALGGVWADSWMSKRSEENKWARANCTLQDFNATGAQDCRQVVSWRIAPLCCVGASCVGPVCRSIDRSIAAAGFSPGRASHSSRLDPTDCIPPSCAMRALQMPVHSCRVGVVLTGQESL